jgi:hypothetical protein
MSELTPKGFAAIPRTATDPQNTDLLGIQQGEELLDMKKISYEDLKKPIVGETWDGTTLKEVNDHAGTLQDQVDALSVGGPKGVYDTLVDLQTADPDHSFTYVVEADGNWYFYDTVTVDWVSGGIYNDSTAFNDLAGVGRTTETVKANADAITTLNADEATEGSVAKSIKDEVDPIDERLDTAEGNILTKVKLTKMPDGATAVYSQDAWEATDGFGYNSNGDLTVLDGTLIFKATSASSRWFGRSIANTAGKILVIKYQSPVTITVQVNNGVTSVKALKASISPTVDIIQLPAYISNPILYFTLASGAIGDSVILDFIWIGDYSYLDNSISTESSRVVNQLGDTAGVGTVASGTITSNGTNVSDGDTVTIAGKVYTFKTALTPAEGEVLIGADSQVSMVNLREAINCVTADIGIKFQTAESHPLVYAASGGTNLSYLYAGRATSGATVITPHVGLLGNSITLATTASTLTTSGSTLTGGTDDVGAKLSTQIASLNGQWITPTLVNNWSNYGSTYTTAKYMKDALGFVHVRGFIKGGSNSTIAFTLPIGFRPSATERFIGIDVAVPNGMISVTNSGNVEIYGSTFNNFSICSVTFKAEA